MTKSPDIQSPTDQPDEPPIEASPAADRRDGVVGVTISVAHTTRDGITHQPDTALELSAAEARHVLHIGHGRLTAPKENAS